MKTQTKEDMKIIKDGRILYNIKRKNKLFNYHPTYKYLVHDCSDAEICKIVEPMGYKITYFDGCFNPFLTKGE